MRLRSRFIAPACLAIVLLTFISTASAGPPLLCHEIKIEKAKSLPWGSSPFKKDSAYNIAALVQDTLDALRPETPVLVRMETLRRATVYIERDRAKADELLGALMARVLDAEAAMDDKWLGFAYFDAGYAAAALQQAGVGTSFGPGVTKGEGGTSLHGYTWVVRGYKLAGENADMALALALITADSHATEFDIFARRAITAGNADDPARKDLLGWVAQIRGITLDALREKYGTTNARSNR